MKKLFYQDQIRELDRETIECEGISSLDLMNSAASRVFDFLVKNIKAQPTTIVVGPGNNGGDGLVVARLLSRAGWPIVVHALRGTYENISDDNRENFELLEEDGVSVWVGEESIHDSLMSCSLVVDALFGTGLSRPIEGVAAQWITEINASDCTVVSIDLPSGLGNEEHMNNPAPPLAVRADYTVSFQFPRLHFFMPEYEEFVGQWHVEDIGLNEDVIDNKTTNIYYTDASDVENMLHPRSRFAHKGTFGRALLVAGSHGMMGAAVLAARACTTHGVGALTVAVPKCGYDIIQSSVPEAMAICGSKRNEVAWTEKMATLKSNAIGIGPGLGRTPQARATVEAALAAAGNEKPIVIDADGLYHLADILKENPDFRFPRHTVLTPHVVEFDRLTRPHATTWQRMCAALNFAGEHQIVVVLKGAYTMIALPWGEMVFNTTGNSGMATAGSGDVLTGIILALLAQGYDTQEAAILGVGLHAAAGDRAAKQWGEMGVTAYRMLC